MNIDQYLSTIDFAPEVLEGLKNIQLVKKEIIERTPKANSQTVEEKYEAMIGRQERLEILNYIIFLQDEGYTKYEIVKMEEDFDYMTKEDIDALIGYEFKERTFFFNVLGTKRSNAAK